MKIYCGVPFMGVSKFNNSYLEIYNEITKLGHQHVDEEFLETNHEVWEKKISQSRKLQNEHYKKRLKAVHLAEICIFEASLHSSGIGFLIQKTLEEGKPCIVLHHKDYTPFFLSGAESEKLIVKSYTEKTLTKVLKQSLLIAKQRRDKRFNFYLSTKLLEYVDNLSKEEGVTKSKVMRDIILRDMKQKDNN